MSIKVKKYCKEGSLRLKALERSIVVKSFVKNVNYG